MGDGPSFVHTIRVRYGEVDLQNVVFNAHYMAYCDDAMETWLRDVGVDGVNDWGWDFMLKKCVIEWQGSAGLRDVIDIGVGIERWGNTSFDVGFRGVVGERPVFTAVITYVGVTPDTHEPLAAPQELRDLLGPGAPA